MNRLDRIETGILSAAVIAHRAKCQRAKVGCVITKNHRIVSSGYNGPLLGVDCSEANCEISTKCKHAVHAEANAIAAASREGISLKDSTLYCTHCPCYECAKLIIQSGICLVIYLNDYKTSNDGFLLLCDSPVEVVRMKMKPEFKNLYDQIKNYTNR
jgi:dCMP deaminase